VFHHIGRTPERPRRTDSPANGAESKQKYRFGAPKCTPVARDQLQGGGIAEVAGLSRRPTTILALELRVPNHRPELLRLVNMIELPGKPAQVLVVLVHGTSLLPPENSAARHI